MTKGQPARRTFPLSGVTEEERALWQSRADERGLTLAAWIRETCTLRATGLLMEKAVRMPVDSGAKVFRGPDPKIKERPRAKK